MRGTSPARRAACLLALPLLLACDLPGLGGGRDDGGRPDTPDPNRDMAAYDRVADDLEARRVLAFGESADEINAVGNRLFWLEFPGFDPVLHAWTASGGEVKYAFAVGTGDAWGYRASEDIVVTTVAKGDGVEYQAWATTAADAWLGSFTLPKPSGAKWFAYAAAGTDVWWVRDEVPGATEVWRKPAGVDALKVLTLESDCGIEVGEFWDFTVDGDRLLLLEGGRLWSVDVPTRKATWLKNQTEVQSFAYDEAGVLYTAATGPFWYEHLSGNVTDVKAAIAASDYRLTPTHASSHLFYEGTVALHGDQAVYVGNSGIFRYGLRGGDVAPILLERFSDAGSVRYRYPTVMADGTLFVQALVSGSGSVGADGPIYRVDAASWVP
jgi:hypothetical protein